METQSKICLVCEEGTTREMVSLNRIIVEGKPVVLNCLYSACDSCGSEFTSSSQSEKNKRERESHLAK